MQNNQVSQSYSNKSNNDYDLLSNPEKIKYLENELSNDKKYIPSHLKQNYQNEITRLNEIIDSSFPSLTKDRIIQKESCWTNMSKTLKIDDGIDELNKKTKHDKKMKEEAAAAAEAEAADNEFYDEEDIEDFYDEDDDF